MRPNKVETGRGLLVVVMGCFMIQCVVDNFLANFLFYLYVMLEADPFRWEMA